MNENCASYEKKIKYSPIVHMASCVASKNDKVLKMKKRKNGNGKKVARLKPTGTYRKKIKTVSMTT